MVSLAQVGKSFEFSAAHYLPEVPEGHKCRGMHGHTYRVELIFVGQVDARGMVLDFAEIAAAWEPVRQVLDHKVLNEIPGLENPTAEVLAAWIGRHFAGLDLESVQVWETASSWAKVVL